MCDAGQAEGFAPVGARGRSRDRSWKARAWGMRAERPLRSATPCVASFGFSLVSLFPAVASVPPASAVGGIPSDRPPPIPSPEPSTRPMPTAGSCLRPRTRCPSASTRATPDRLPARRGTRSTRRPTPLPLPPPPPPHAARSAGGLSGAPVAPARRPRGPSVASSHTSIVLLTPFRCGGLRNLAPPPTVAGKPYHAPPRPTPAHPLPPRRPSTRGGPRLRRSRPVPSWQLLGGASSQLCNREIIRHIKLQSRGFSSTLPRARLPRAGTFFFSLPRPRAARRPPLPPVALSSPCHAAFAATRRRETSVRPVFGFRHASENSVYEPHGACVRPRPPRCTCSREKKGA